MNLGIFLHVTRKKAENKMNMKESSPLRCMMYGKALKHFVPDRLALALVTEVCERKDDQNEWTLSKIWQKPQKKKQVHSETWNGVKHMQIPRLYIICSISNPILKSGTQTGQNQKRERETYEKRGYDRGYY